MKRRSSGSSKRTLHSSRGDLYHPDIAEWKEKNNELRREMEEIRSSSKGELLKAWAEFEELHDEREELLEQNHRLAKEVNATKNREKLLLKQLQGEEEEQGQQDGGGENDNNKGRGGSIGGINFRALLGSMSQNSRRSSTGKRRDSIATTTTISSSRRSSSSKSANNESQNNPQDFVPEISSSTENSNNDTSSIISDTLHSIFHSSNNSNTFAVTLSERERIENEFIHQIRDLEHENKTMLMEWESKLRSRDIVLESLEKMTQIQGSNLDALRQRVIEDDVLSRRRDEDYQKQIDDSRRKVEEKRNIINKQRNRMKKYTTYIEDLTCELRRLAAATTVKKEERRRASVVGQQPSSCKENDYLVRDNHKKNRRRKNSDNNKNNDSSSSSFSTTSNLGIQDKIPPMKQRTEAPASA